MPRGTQIKSRDEGYYDTEVYYNRATGIVTFIDPDGRQPSGRASVEDVIDAIVTERTTGNAVYEEYYSMNDEIRLNGRPVEIPHLEGAFEDTRSFEEYMADEYGYDPGSVLWDSEGYYGDGVDVVTAFYKHLVAFSRDDRIEIFNARIDDDGDLRVTLRDAR